MAITNNNPLLTGVRGRIGNLVVKQYKNGTVITLMPSYTKRKPTTRQKQHRDIFAAAVKYGRAEKHKHLLQYGQVARTESQDIYHKSIQAFMLAVRRIRQNEVKFESSWEGLGDKQFTAEMISLATSIVTGEYDKKQESVKKQAKAKVAKKAILKKAVLKKPIKKAAKKK